MRFGSPDYALLLQLRKLDTCSFQPEWSQSAVLAGHCMALRLDDVLHVMLHWGQLLLGV